jgi:Fe2+ or Zn2+ uptake regulation protein
MDHPEYHTATVAPREAIQEIVDRDSAHTTVTQEHVLDLMEARGFGREQVRRALQALVVDDVLDIGDGDIVTTR